MMGLHGGDIYSTEHNNITMTVPAGFGGFRAKVQEAHYAVDGENGIMVNGISVWTQPVCTQCPTVVTHTVSAGDKISFHASGLLAIFTFELLKGSVTNTAEADCSRYDQDAILECNRTLPNGDLRVDFGQSNPPTA